MFETPVELELRRVSNLYLTVVSITLLVYDYCLTFPLEVSRFWIPGGFTWAAFFFYLNRYSALFGHITVFFEYLSRKPPSEHTCNKLQLFHQTFSVVGQVIIGIMLMMRTYALYARSKKILILMLLISCGVLVAGLWAFISAKGKTVGPYMTCPPSLSKEEAIRFGSAWSGMLVFDTMIFLLTFHRAFALRPSTGTSILHILLRDGGVYYAAMFCANLFNFLTYVVGGPRLRGIGTTFTNAISSIMMSRLTLNLRDPTLKRSKHTMDTSQTVSTVVDQPNSHSEWTEFTNPFFDEDTRGDIELNPITRSATLSRIRGERTRSINFTSP